MMKEKRDGLDLCLDYFLQIFVNFFIIIVNFDQIFEELCVVGISPHFSFQLHI